MKTPESSDARLHAIAKDPRYIELVRRRSATSWWLTAVILVIFFGYTSLVALAGPVLGIPLAGMTTTIGIPVGIFVILSAVVLTGVYVRIANRQFDAAMDAIVRGHSE